MMNRRDFLKLTGVSGLLAALGLPIAEEVPPEIEVEPEQQEIEPGRVSRCVCVDIPGSLILFTAESEIQIGERLYAHSDGCVSNEKSGQFVGYAWGNAQPGSPVSVVIYSE